MRPPRVSPSFFARSISALSRERSTRPSFRASSTSRRSSFSWLSAWLCALNAEQRGVTKDEAAAGVLFGSQYDLAQMIDAADRFMSFG